MEKIDVEKELRKLLSDFASELYHDKGGKLYRVMSAEYEAKILSLFKVRGNK